jgi:adenosine kinase
LTIVVNGSIAYDYIMSFPGYFKEHILPDKIESLSVSFLVDSMRRERGGCAANIAYNLALLGERPRVMGTVGQDFAAYRAWLEERGIDTSTIVEIEDEFTASFFVSTDRDNNQIASFYTGAMGYAYTLSFKDQDYSDIEIAIISPSDPGAMMQHARECQELGIPYIYDPSQQIIRLSGEDLIDGMRGARILIVNDYEFEMIRHKTGLWEREILNLVETLIVTRGREGSSIMTADQTIHIPIVLPRRVADPTGVGDAYRAGIIKGYICGFSWETTGRIGSLAATYVLEEHGTQNHRYTLPEFVARYRQHFGQADELESGLDSE